MGEHEIGERLATMETHLQYIREKVGSWDSACAAQRKATEESVAKIAAQIKWWRTAIILSLGLAIGSGIAQLGALLNLLRLAAM